MISEPHGDFGKITNRIEAGDVWVPDTERVMSLSRLLTTLTRCLIQFSKCKCTVDKSRARSVASWAVEGM